MKASVSVNISLQNRERKKGLHWGSRPWCGICSHKPPHPSFVVPMYPYLGVSRRSRSQVPNLEPSWNKMSARNHREKRIQITPVFWLNDSTTNTNGLDPIFLIVSSSTTFRVGLFTNPTSRPNCLHLNTASQDLYNISPNETTYPALPSAMISSLPGTNS